MRARIEWQGSGTTSRDVGAVTSGLATVGEEGTSDEVLAPMEEERVRSSPMTPPEPGGVSLIRGDDVPGDV